MVDNKGKVGKFSSVQSLTEFTIDSSGCIHCLEETPSGILCRCTNCTHYPGEEELNVEKLL